MSEEPKLCGACSKPLKRRLGVIHMANGGRRPAESEINFRLRLTCGEACHEELRVRTWSEKNGCLHTPAPAAWVPSAIPAGLRMGRRRL